MAASPTPNLAFQNFYSAVLTAPMTNISLDAFLDVVPVGAEGFLVIDPDSTTAREIIYYNSKTGTKVTAPSVADGRGQDGTAAVSHEAGTLVIMAPIAAFYTYLRSLFSTTPQGYTSVAANVTSVVANGNRSYTASVDSDQTAVLSPGHRIRATRTIAAPTQCTSLNGSTQYYSKTTPAGMTFTTSWAVGVWVKLSSYPTAAAEVISRYNGTSGWILEISSAGQVLLIGRNGGAANQRYVQTFQSIPLNKWVHIVAQNDMSVGAGGVGPTTSYVMIDGVDVPVTVVAGGTSPTSILQAGNLEVGSSNGGLFPFPGKIAQAFVTSAKLTQTQVRSIYSQGITASDVSAYNMVSAFSFNNSSNDLNTTNANNLTAVGAPSITNADSPFTQNSNYVPTGNLDYAIVTAVTASTITLQVPEGCTIPTSGGVSALAYSGNKAPFGFPLDREKWRVKYINRAISNTNGTVALNTWFNSTANLGSPQLLVPAGAFELMWSANAYYFKAGASLADWKGTLSTANNTESDTEMSAYVNYEGPAGTIDVRPTMTRTKGYTNAAATPYYFNVLTTVSGIGDLGYSGNNGAMTIIAEPSYL